MEPMTPTETLFMGLGVLAIVVVVLLGIRALTQGLAGLPEHLGGMIGEDEHGEGL